MGSYGAFIAYDESTASREHWSAIAQIIPHSAQSSPQEGPLEATQMESRLITTSNFFPTQALGIYGTNESFRMTDDMLQPGTTGSHFTDCDDGDMDNLQHQNFNYQLPTTSNINLDFAVCSRQQEGPENYFQSHGTAMLNRNAANISNHTSQEYLFQPIHEFYPTSHPYPPGESDGHAAFVSSSTERVRYGWSYPQTLYSTMAQIDPTSSTLEPHPSYANQLYPLDANDDHPDITGSAYWSMPTNSSSRPPSVGMQVPTEATAVDAPLVSSAPGSPYECAFLGIQDTAQEYTQLNTAANVSQGAPCFTASSPFSASSFHHPHHGYRGHMSPLVYSVPPGDPCSIQSKTNQSIDQQGRSPFHEQNPSITASTSHTPSVRSSLSPLHSTDRSGQPGTSCEIIVRDQDKTNTTTSRRLHIKANRFEPYKSCATRSNIDPPISISVLPPSVSSAYHASFGNITPDSVSKARTARRRRYTKRSKTKANSVSPSGPFDYCEPGNFHSLVPLEDVMDKSTGMYQEWRPRDIMICTISTHQIIDDSERKNIMRKDFLIE